MASKPALYAPEDVDLSDMEFWTRPPEDRAAAFAALRRSPHPRFYPEPELLAEAGFPRGPGFHALVRHSDVVEASRNPKVFSSARGATTIADMPTEINEFFGSFANMDAPRHARLRRIVARSFTPRMLQKFEDDLAVATAGIVDELIERGPCDFVEAVAANLPLKIICDMMGIPERDRLFVFDRTNIIFGRFDPDYRPADPNAFIGALLTAGTELTGLVQDLTRHRKEHPGDDLTTTLIHANVDGEQLTEQEVASFFILLVVAGNETTRNAISHGLMLLTEHPAQRELWKSDFEQHAPTAVQEIVRVASPVIWMRRTLTRDWEMNGNAYAEGDKVLMFYWSANRDELVFEEPDRFDITRDPNPHTSFGGPGPHYCIGAHLARREMTVLFDELFRRVPDLSAAGPPERLYSNFINGIKRLPCTFGR